MKITGTRGYIQIEDDDGTVARFDGESCLGGFYAYADFVCWVRYQGEKTDKDRLSLIYRATRYGKENHIRILFFDKNYKVMFETELGLKTEVYRSNDAFIWMAVVVLSLCFSALLIEILDVADPVYSLVVNSAAGLSAILLLFYNFMARRYRIVAEGDVMTVTPGLGRAYSFPVSEIVRVLRETEPDFGWQTTKKITIDTGYRQISLNRGMDGIDDMDAYLIRHIDREKIITKEVKHKYGSV